MIQCMLQLDDMNIQLIEHVPLDKTEDHSFVLLLRDMPTDEHIELFYPSSYQPLQDIALIIQADNADMTAEQQRQLAVLRDRLGDLAGVFLP